VNVTFTNNWVRSDSAVQTLWHENRSYVHNKPFACVNPTSYKANNANSYTITTDASCSTDDVGISQYSWDFRFNQQIITNGSSPYETITFPSTPRSYTCTLFVLDVGIPGVPNSGEEWNVTFIVTVSFL
jgi:hypothetical protein